MAEPSRLPGAALLHPLPVAAALLVAFNDLVVRAHWPGFLSGKLSDVGICFLLPVVLVAIAEWMRWSWARCARGSWKPSDRSLHLASCLVAGGYFALLQVSSSWGDMHRAIISGLAGGARVVTPDLTDLACLVFCALALRYLDGGPRRTRRAGGPATVSVAGLQPVELVHSLAEDPVVPRDPPHFAPPCPMTFPAPAPSRSRATAFHPAQARAQTPAPRDRPSPCGSCTRVMGLVRVQHGQQRRRVGERSHASPVSAK